MTHSPSHPQLDIPKKASFTTFSYFVSRRSRADDGKPFNRLFFFCCCVSHREEKTFSFLSVGNITSITQFPVAIESLSVATKIDNGPAAALRAYPHKHRLKGLHENNTSDSDFDLKSVFAFTQQHQKKNYTLLMAGTIIQATNWLETDSHQKILNSQ